MQITMRPMTKEEAWDSIFQIHRSYHKNLKHFGVKHDGFIPDNIQLHEMFSKDTLTEHDIEKYKNVMLNLYDVNKLQRLNNIFETETKPMFEHIIHKYLSAVIPSWGAVLPKSIEILCTYGKGGSYQILSKDKVKIIYRMSREPENKERVFNLLFHEFIHTLIEKPIIRKYNVPQDLKERIVDLICWKYCQKPVQPMYANSFANKYITSEIIEKDLPNAVKKMMDDYMILKQKQELQIV